MYAEYLDAEFAGPILASGLLDDFCVLDVRSCILVGLSGLHGLDPRLDLRIILAEPSNWDPVRLDRGQGIIGSIVVAGEACGREHRFTIFSRSRLYYDVITVRTSHVLRFVSKIGEAVNRHPLKGQEKGNYGRAVPDGVHRLNDQQRL
jgi:hypothetical protein